MPVGDKKKAEKRPHQKVENFYKPLRGQKYFLHVKPVDEESLTKKIRLYGGATAAILDRVDAVVTDDPSFLQFSANRRRLADQGDAADDADVRRRSESSATTTTTMASGGVMASLGPAGADVGGESSTNATLMASIGGGLRKFYSKMPSILRQALELQVKITTLHRFRQILTEIDLKLEALNSKRKCKVPTTPQKLTLHHQTRHQQQNLLDQKKPLYTTLRSPYLKFEDRARNFCPVYKSFYNEGWPKIIIKPGARGCPFERKQKQNFDENPSEEGKKSAPKKMGKFKRKECSAYCDLCQCWADNVNLHVTGDMHRRNACCKANYIEIDRLMADGPTLNHVLDHFTNGNLSQSDTVGVVDSELINAITSIESVYTETLNFGQICTDAENPTLHSPPIPTKIPEKFTFACKVSPVFRGSTIKRHRRHTVAEKFLIGNGPQKFSDVSGDLPRDRDTFLLEPAVDSQKPFEFTRNNRDYVEECYVEYTASISVPSYVTLQPLVTAESV